LDSKSRQPLCVVFYIAFYIVFMLFLCCFQNGK
jgi:hypothetical protein